MSDALPNAKTAIQEFMEGLGNLQGVRGDVAKATRALWESGELGRQKLLERLRKLENEGNGDG